MIEISFDQRIRELRDKAGLSLRKLADQIDISSPFLSDIELGRRFPSEEILAKLAGALLRSNSDRKAAGFGLPPSCTVLTAARHPALTGILKPGLRRSRPSYGDGSCNWLGQYQIFGSPG